MIHEGIYSPRKIRCHGSYRILHVMDLSSQSNALILELRAAAFWHQQVNHRGVKLGSRVTSTGLARPEAQLSVRHLVRVRKGMGIGEDQYWGGRQARRNASGGGLVG